MMSLSLLPIDVRLVCPREVAVRVQLAFEDIAGAPVNIAGDTIAIVVRDSYGGVQQFTEVATITDAAGGLAELVFSEADLTDGRTSGVTYWVYVITRTHVGETVPWWGGVFEIRDTAVQGSLT